jgi:hypothetical protein
MKLYGVYSAKSAAMFHDSIYIWTRPDGTEVEVTGVYDQPNDPAYLWPDAVWLGEVLTFIRKKPCPA